MSTTLAIATVTSALASLLRKARDPLPGDPPDDTSLGDLDVTTTPLDLARAQKTSNQLNLFLYGVSINPALRNVAMPIAGSGTLASAPLALDLHYLLTAYGKDDRDEAAHRALGRAMTILHRHAVLFPSELELALAEGGVHEQRERVRITPAPMSVEETSKLWTTFQTQYRLSVSYQVSVVLLESGATVRSATPVLRPAIAVSPGPLAVPTIERLVHAGDRPASIPGASFTIEGRSLDRPSLQARLLRPFVPSPLELDLAGTLDGRSATATLPSPGVPPLRAGTYVLELVAPGGVRSAPVPFAIAPTITDLAPQSFVAGSAPALELDVTFAPAVEPAQRVELAFGDRIVPSEDRTADATTIRFRIPAPALGRHQVRLRVDGVESLLAIVPGDTPIYDSSCVVEVQP